MLVWLIYFARDRICSCIFRNNTNNRKAIQHFLVTWLAPGRSWRWLHYVTFTLKDCKKWIWLGEVRGNFLHVERIWEFWLIESELLFRSKDLEQGTYVALRDSLTFSIMVILFKFSANFGWKRPPRQSKLKIKHQRISS